ncbi:MAG TPA: hypothetical protein VNX88_08960 [Terriglobales bacterium]|nr:hypothetical protein [Terriglobales bacterium]
MLKRHEVEILLKAGHAKTEVARLSGVSLRSVKRIAEEHPVGHVDDVAERRKRQIGRPSTVVTFRKQVVEILQEAPDLATLEILRRVRESGYRGGKTWLYALVASLRPKVAKPLVRFEGLPGEFSQHDFGQVEVEFRDGTRERIHFFASRLKYSRLVRVSLVKDERVESLVRTLAEHRAAMVAAVSGKRGKRYLKRQQLLELGEPAIRYLTEIVHRRPRQWFEDVDRLHQILQSHGPDVLRRAMEEGLKQQIFGAFYVERSLQAELSFPQVVQ